MKNQKQLSTGDVMDNRIQLRFADYFVNAGQRELRRRLG